MTLWMRDQENIEKGIEQERETIVINMYRRGFPLEQIVLATMKTAEEVEDIIRKSEQGRQKEYRNSRF